jgi:hypothetical protein
LSKSKEGEKESKRQERVTEGRVITEGRMKSKRNKKVKGT